ncbi:SGNH/GDSL hydrolase family protein [Rubrobacter indicoceani]|uniref:SGNH/GDSL hydrolase family protein n=1 Tax=Rubrobacter indicoceani TaxID=2051957 RepID=UPI000E5C07B8|nr:SGNH/GDSL hydrolase family protein [Rubrobacter indicoceani]
MYRPPLCSLLRRPAFFLACLVLTFLASVACLSGDPDDGGTYISLGDSLAVGVGSSDPDELGYAPLYREALSREAGAEVTLVQLGISGETSASFIGGYPDSPSQLGDAVEALRSNPGARVTLSLGGNDLIRAGETAAERSAALSDYAANLDYILTTLAGASDPAPEVSVLAVYNPAPGAPTGEWVERLNREIRAIASGNGATVAAGDRAFEGNEEEYARYARYPGDIHPTDAGHAALARAFERAGPDF